ncbi:hypothetical protein KEM09_20370 [Carboxylicivirga mesophila]|uniref:TANFOR domain-containing protein n=1 Tax=Carboxylicivirga mesophila TaxID=1166478 RepID=A0ABS5KFR1_9BACT|nr:hypothetical protein [Carboxylicivirga mesophila]MBS2213775.1 hypothetical protein [Carboxylicivirga mesophila]
MNKQLTENLKRFSLSILLAFYFLSSLFSNNYEAQNVRYFDEFELPDEAVFIAEQFDMQEPANTIEAEHEYDLILDKVISEGRITNQLNKSALYSLPIGISVGGNASYMIVINEAKILNNHAIFNAFMVLTNPLDGSKLRFEARNIAFTFGSGLLDGFQLELIEKKEVKIINDASLWIKEGSYVDWDCNGFNQLGLNAELELNEKRFKKVNPQTGQEEGKVSALFSVTVSSFQDILVDLSLAPFKMVGFNEAYFSFENLTFDYSDARNSSEFALPSDYPGDFSGEMTTLWRGIYVNEARVYLSGKLSNKNGQVTSIYAKKFLLDNYGLTGFIGATNVLSLKDGEMGNWPFSIKELELELFTSEVRYFGLEGQVQVQGADKTLDYDAFYDAEGIYHFGISVGEDLPFNALAAEVNLHQSSRIEVTVDNGKFYPAAELHGQITFACAKGGGGKLLNIPKLDFEGLRIATLKPYLDIDYLGMASDEDMSFNEFPITITEASFRKTSDAGLFTFGVKLNLSPAKDDGIVGETVLGIKTDTSGDKWKYDGLSIDKIYVKASKEGAFEIEGTILFAKGDPVYGDGFRGDLDAKFANSFDLQAIAVFGKVNGFRYFFVDAFLTLPSPGVTAGPFIMNGFGGGMYYRMKQNGDGDPGGEMGKSISGLTYSPDKDSHLAIRAAVQGGIVYPKIISCKVNFLIQFNRHGGINLVSFDGQAVVATPQLEASVGEVKAMSRTVVEGKKLKIPSHEVMKATISIVMDFEHDVFHSEMELFVDAGLIRGINKNNSAGRGVMHIDPNKWYLHLGRPDAPIGLELVGLVKVGGYFMAGHDIPDAMVMHPKVLEYLNMDNSDFNGNRSEGEIIMGKGLAFGANFELDTGDLRFLIFYARFELGGGFDVMLLDYGDKAYCEGLSGGVGINGWYGKGQAYAYFGGKIGIKVKLFFKTRKFDIISLQTAAAIRLEGPNPTWMKGVVGGQYRILGGLIKGKCKFEMRVGTKCELRTMSDLSDLEIIADLAPASESKDVDIFTLPQAVFNMPIDKVIRISEDVKLTKTFKVQLAEYSIYKDKHKISGSYELDAEQTTLAYTPDRIFDPKSTYKVVAKVSFQEYKDGQWQAYKDDSGKVYYETKEAQFTTGVLPDRIPSDYIQYSYPMDRQVNFYKKEYGTAYITFKSDLEPFFVPQEGWKQQARWTPVNGQAIYSDISYRANDKTAEAVVPESLVSGKVHAFELVNVPIDSNNAINRNVKETTSSTVDSNTGSTTEVTTREALGSISEAEEKAFYTIPFRVSNHDRFLDKVSANEMNVRFLYNASPGVDLLGATYYGPEFFDRYEINGDGDIQPLIQREAVLNGADWYQTNIYPLIYEGYPIHSKALIDYRDTNEYGVPPVKRIDMWQVGYNYLLTDADIESGTVTQQAEMTHLIYTLQEVWSADYANIRNNIANTVSNGLTPTSRMTTILNKYPAPQVSAGNYPIKLSYVLPGRNTVTSEKVINMKNGFEVKQVDLIEE